MGAGVASGAGVAIGGGVAIGDRVPAVGGTPDRDDSGGGQSGIPVAL